MGGQEMIHIAIVDPHPIVRLGLWQYFASLPTTSPRQEFAASREFRAWPGGSIDVVVAEAEMLSGLGSVRESAATPGAARASIHTVVFAANDDPELAMSTLRQGALAFVRKSEDLSRLRRAVERAAAGLVTVPEWMTVHDFYTHAKSSKLQLTPRELDILGALARGRSSSQIASEYGISRSTVSTFLGRLRQKFRASTNCQLIRYALESGRIA